MDGPRSRSRCGSCWGRDVDIWRRLGRLDLDVEKSRLELYYVLAEGVVVVLDGFVVLLHLVVIAHLLLELLDVVLLALTEGSLRDGCSSVNAQLAGPGHRCDTLRAVFYVPVQLGFARRVSIATARAWLSGHR